MDLLIHNQAFVNSEAKGGTLGRIQPSPWYRYRRPADQWVGTFLADNTNFISSISVIFRFISLDEVAIRPYISIAYRGDYDEQPPEKNWVDKGWKKAFQLQKRSIPPPIAAYRNRCLPLDARRKLLKISGHNGQSVQYSALRP